VISSCDEMCARRALNCGANGISRSLLIRRSVSTLAYQVANRDDPHEAVLLTRSAAAGAQGHSSSTTRALLEERVAWAHARVGEIRHTERALSAVDTEYDRRRPADDPEWVYWLDEDEIIMAGRCYVELQQPDRAIPLLPDVLDRYDERQTRESALYTSWLAEAHVQAGDIEHAAALADRTLELSSSTSSSRGDDRVTLLAQRLGPYLVVSTVREFLDHEAGWRGADKPGSQFTADTTTAPGSALGGPYRAGRRVVSTGDRQVATRVARRWAVPGSAFNDQPLTVPAAPRPWM
jgi:hypothetical protein